MSAIEKEKPDMTSETNSVVIEHTLALAFANAHPFFWPTVSKTPPRWWQRQSRRSEAKINSAIESLGYLPLNQYMRDNYWREVRKGQGVNEDAGGYGLRQWLGMLGLPTGDVVTYADFVRSALAEPTS